MRIKKLTLALVTAMALLGAANAHAEQGCVATGDGKVRCGTIIVK